MYSLHDTGAGRDFWSAVPALEIAELALIQGGRIAVQPDARQRLVPTTAQYTAVFHVVSPAAIPRSTIRGLIHVAGRPESLLARTWRRTLKILMQESGA